MAGTVSEVILGLLGGTRYLFVQGFPNLVMLLVGGALL